MRTLIFLTESDWNETKESKERHSLSTEKCSIVQRSVGVWGVSDFPSHVS